MTKTKKNFRYWALQILIIAGIIYVSTKISFLFEPIGIFFSTLFFPIIISGFLFFLLNPFVGYLQRLKLPRILAILVIYVVIIGIIGLVIGNLIPMLSKQITEFANDVPTYYEKTILFLDQLSKSDQFKWIMTQEYFSISDIVEELNDYAATLPTRITNSISGIVGVIANIAITIVTVPFLLFYMFKDGEKFPNLISKFIPFSYRKEGLKTVKETGETLAAYINGQITVALFVGTLSFIGYLIIDLPYALVMALIVAVTNIIPYVGPFLGGTPAVIIALFDSPTKALLVIIVITIAQQLEGNVLSPLILGKRLDTHPATIILLLLVAGNLAGILGMILAIPTYAVLKTIILNFVRFLQLKKSTIDTTDG
ncbi:AI-2E family transporter [Bacillus sp. V3B]|uniref:AI-2E family transporter n=1 Tax=Bacillus sp. V3B TaxID=2804915 RepID=UPI00210E6425|nr:AI-2E family transporter [Bacillus sp. V3B]